MRAEMFGGAEVHRCEIAAFYSDTTSPVRHHPGQALQSRAVSVKVAPFLHEPVF